MGEQASFSRILCLYLGSPFTYVSLGKAIAPGQFSLNEMKTFVYKNGRPDHAEGFHDDLLMALAMPLWVLEHSFKKSSALFRSGKFFVKLALTTE